MVREHQKQKDKEVLESRLIEGLESGKPLRVTVEYLDKRRNALLKKIKKIKKL